MAYEWENLQGRMNCFTVRNATMVDLKTRKPVRCYSANTRITIVQKCVTDKGTLYRTAYAKENGLDWAFKASAFGLPDEKAPSVPSVSPLSKTKPVNSHTKSGTKKQKVVQNKAEPKDGETKPKLGWIKKLFGRKHG